MATSKLFGAREKLLCQALKGVHYESGSQKCRWEDAAHDKQEDSSSSEETNDDDEEEDEGAVARKKLLKKKPRSDVRPLMKSENMWHWSHLIVTVFPLNPLHPPVPLHIPNFQIFLFRLRFHIFEPSCQN